MSFLIPILTYTFSKTNSFVRSIAWCRLRLTQNQVVETSCWFESGQGHQSDLPI